MRMQVPTSRPGALRRCTVMVALLALSSAVHAADEHAHHHHHAAAASASAPVEAPPLSILLPEDGATVGRQLAVVFETPGDIASLTMDAPVIGVHLHIDSDEFSVMPTSKQLIRLGEHRYLFVFELPAKPGEQTLRLSWGDAMHRTIESSVQKVTVRVQADPPSQR